MNVLVKMDLTVGLTFKIVQITAAGIIKHPRYYWEAHRLPFFPVSTAVVPTV